MVCCTECEYSNYKKSLAAMAAGALTQLSGADKLFVSLGAPESVHWALGGVAASAALEMELPWLDVQTAKCAAAGYAGGYLIKFLANR